jgi:acetyl/propionyl-CoA carboxylase alpha subunit
MDAADRLGTAVIQITRAAAPGELIARDDDRPLAVERLFAVTAAGKTWVFHDGIVYEIAAEGDAVRRAAHAHGALTAPMPATIIEIKVAAGDLVKKGDILIVLEAMKMELPVRAPGEGRVKAVHGRPGDLVQPETTLIELE